MTDETNSAPAPGLAEQALTAALSPEEPAAATEETAEPVETDAPPTEPQVPTYTVLVDGQEREVPLPELLRGYSGTAKTTQELQRLAERRKELDAEAVRVRERQTQYGTLLGQVEQALTALTPTEPNWPELKATLSATDYANAVDSWRTQSGRLHAVKAERDRVAKEQADAFAHEVEAVKRQEADRLHNAVPEWQDPTKAQTERAQLLEFAKTRGFSEQELAGIYDHRAWLLLRDAMRWQQATAKKPQAEAKIRTAAPGSPAAKPAPKADVDRLRDRAKKTGRIADAAAAFSAMIPD